MTDTELTVSGSDSTLKATSHSIRLADNSTLEIFIASAEQDDISTGIANHTYGFPAGFELLSALAAPGQRVLDLGAHIGTFSLLAAKLGYQVASVEASPRNAALLQASANFNHFENLRLISAAVSDRNETLEFIQAGPYGLVATPYVDMPTITVQAMSVDEMLTQLGWDRVDFIKMDVEGSEVKAVHGMKSLLTSPDAPSILYESNGHTLHYFGETPNTLLASLEAVGYRSYLVEGKQLIPLAASELIFTCTVDCLATKVVPSALSGWRLRASLSREERISQILSMGAHPHPHLRSFIARTLQNAELDIVAENRVTSVMEKLVRDPDSGVRENAAWFQNDDFQHNLALVREANPSPTALQSAKSWLKRTLNRLTPR